VAKKNMATVTESINKQAALKAKHAALNAKVAAMTDEQKEVRVREIYAMPDASDDDCRELFTIMVGDTPTHDR
jgi:hypothetical protein